MRGLLTESPELQLKLKPDRILIDSEGIAVILYEKSFKDSCSKINEHENSVEREETIWYSPELLKAGNKDQSIEPEKSYIFTLGLLALSCIDPKEFVQRPNLNTDERAMEDYMNQIRFKLNHKRFYYLLRCMLSFSPMTRPSFDQIYEDLFEFIQPLKPQSNGSELLNFSIQSSSNSFSTKVKNFYKEFFYIK